MYYAYLVDCLGEEIKSYNISLIKQRTKGFPQVIREMYFWYYPGIFIFEVIKPWGQVKYVTLDTPFKRERGDHDYILN